MGVCSGCVEATIGLEGGPPDQKKSIVWGTISLVPILILLLRTFETAISVDIIRHAADLGSIDVGAGRMPELSSRVCCDGQALGPPGQSRHAPDTPQARC